MTWKMASRKVWPLVRSTANSSPVSSSSGKATPTPSLASSRTATSTLATSAVKATESGSSCGPMVRPFKSSNEVPPNQRFSFHAILKI